MFGDYKNTRTPGKDLISDLISALLKYLLKKKKLLICPIMHNSNSR